MDKKSRIAAFISLLFIIFTCGNTAALQLPEWIENTFLNGDITLHQSEIRRGTLENSSQQGFVKALLGIESTITNEWKVGIGIETGSNFSLNDPRHRYQTIGRTFDTDALNPDHSHTLFTPFTPGYFMLDDWVQGIKNSSMIAFKPGVKWNVDQYSILELAVTYYTFNNIRDNRFWYNSETNNMNDMIYRYDTLVANMQLSYYLDEIMQNRLTEIIPYAAVFTQWSNSKADTADRGFLLGVKFGNERVNEAGQWQFLYNWRKLERNAWLDFFPNNEFYRGESAAKGSEAELKIGLRNNLIFGLDYYYAKPIGPRDTVNEEKEYLLKADFVFKF